MNYMTREEIECISNLLNALLNDILEMNFTKNKINYLAETLIANKGFKTTAYTINYYMNEYLFG